jgi:hypothetical protein
MSAWTKRPLAVEFIVVATSAISVWFIMTDGAHFSITLIDDANTSASILSGLAGFFGTMLGFVIAIVTFLLSVADNTAFVTLRASLSYSKHWAIFVGALYSCFAATSLAVSGLLVSCVGLFTSVHAIIIFAVSLWGLLRLALVLWVISKMVQGEIRIGHRSRNRLLSANEP